MKLLTASYVRRFMYFTAVLDCVNIMSLRLPNMLDIGFCVEALVFSTYEGAQFAGNEKLQRFKAWGILISMLGGGRPPDNDFVELLWRACKHEDINLRGYYSSDAMEHGLGS